MPTEPVPQPAAPRRKKSAPQPKTRRVPLRSCVVCREPSDKRTLLRVARAPEAAGGVISADPTGKKPGRGAYVCADDACIDAARKRRSFERALKTAGGNVDESVFVELKSLAASKAQQASAEPASQTPSGSTQPMATL